MDLGAAGAGFGAAATGFGAAAAGFAGAAAGLAGAAAGLAASALTATLALLGSKDPNISLHIYSHTVKTLHL